VLRYLARAWSRNLLVCCSVAQQTVEAWRSVFYISAGVYAFGTVFYGLFASGELQSWAAAKDDVIELNVNTVYGTEQRNH